MHAGAALAAIHKNAVTAASSFPHARGIRLVRRLLVTALAIVLCPLWVSAQSLQFGNNFFVTGDYVVSGWANKQIDPQRAGYAIGTISIPDTLQSSALKTAQAGVATQVPAGADIVGAFLYWTTVEKSQSAFAGQQAFFRGYPITGISLDQSAPVSWSAGGCAGSSNGTSTMRVYRADVRAYLPVDAKGVIQPNTSYSAEFADSGSNGNTAPFTLGASLIVIYRVLGAPNVPLTAVVIYDGAFAPSNAGSSMSQRLEGFYQPSALNRISKITHIVGNGQSKKNESVLLNGTTLTPLYGKSLPPFPGLYNGSWDNPTWNVSTSLNAPPSDNFETTMVNPASSNGGCVSWGAIVFSTTVQDSDNDGLLDYWEAAPGASNPVNPNGATPGYVDVGTGQFVALPNADPLHKDMFIQLDSMCSGNVVTNPDYSSTCGTSGGGVSFQPSPGALSMLSNAFSAKGITLHLDTHSAVAEQTCTDNYNISPPKLCSYPNQPGVVGWKAGFTETKNQPLNYPDESSCRAALNGACIRRFQQGRKDSYHYVLAANALGVANWTFSGALTSLVVDSKGVATFTTSVAPGLVASDAVNGNGRVTVMGALSAPALNGVYFVTSTMNANPGDPAPHTFTIQTANVPAGSYTLSTDPTLAVASGKGGTGSGFSDLGGQDSLITLGLWGADGQPDTVQAGTVMHEVGHTLGLSHGGSYNDSPGSYVLNFEPNCKPNYQSVMNYLFQVDLLQDASGNQVLDYSEQGLAALNELSLSGIISLTAVDGSASTYSATSWYSPVPPNGAGSAAKAHCDGTPLAPNTDPQPTMFRIPGLAGQISPAWANGQDINFNGSTDSTLRGFNDWANLDLRQIGATGSLSTAGVGDLLGAGGVGDLLGAGGTGDLLGAGGVGDLLGAGGVGDLLGAGGVGDLLGAGGMGNGEITRETANSIVRPPRNLAATPSDTRLAHSVTLNWTKPVFGQIVSYNVYRGANGAAPTLYFSTSSGQTPAATSFTDTNVTDCTTYTYFVTSLLADGRESVASNSATYFDPCPPQALSGTFVAATQSSPNQVSLSWGAPVSGAVASYDVYRATGATPLPTDFTLIATAIAGTSYIDTSAFTNNTTYTYVVTDLLQDTTGCSPNQNCRESSGSNAASVPVHFTVTPAVTWPTASAIVFGQSLASSTLTGGSASYNGAAVDGKFAFTDATIVPPSAGTYQASVTFTPTDTYNFNSVTGTVFVPVNTAPTTTTITGIVAAPNPPMLGQTITVNFTVSPAAATGSVTITEDSGASCTGALTNGAGSCAMTLNVLTASGKSAVGNRTLTAVYSGNANYAQSSNTFSLQVVYRFVGFLSPLSAAGSYSGAFNLGKAVPIKWQLMNSSATTFLTMSNLNVNSSGMVDLLLQAIFNGPPPASGKCPVSLTPATASAKLSLFSPVNGVTGNSSFRYDTTNNQFIFNWDTTVNLGAGCYTLTVVLDDALPQPPQLTSKPLWATSLQLK